MSEYKEIFDHSSYKNEAKDKIKRLKEVTEKINKLWGWLTSEVEAYEVEAYKAETNNKEREIKLEIIQKMQKDLRMLMKESRHLKGGIERSLESHELGREVLLNWKPNNDKVN